MMKPDAVAPFRIGRWVKDPFSGLSHALGALLSVAGLAFLLSLARGRPWLSAAVTVYGTSLVLLFSASALAHSIRCSPARERRLDQFDVAAIYLLIAGSYTPICLGPLRSTCGWPLLTLEWGLAAVGICTVPLLGERVSLMRVVVYVLMGWMGFAFAAPIVRALPAGVLAWLLAGGAAYTVGAVVFTTNRPRLWPGWFVAHDLWHVLVLIGGGCHFIAVATLVAASHAGPP